MSVENMDMGHAMLTGVGDPDAIADKMEQHVQAGGLRDHGKEN